ncbi:MAG: MOSC domain-containing protein [Lachnospiraceae bacterium]
MGIVRAVCISEKRGTVKKNITTCRLIENYGLEHDAHAGDWHRQVSLLSYEKIEEFKEKGAPVEEGSFGENLVVEGFDFKNLPVGTRLKCRDVLLELTQIGKECHSGCEIYKIMGDCIMPREGVFARVLHGGTISEGDVMTAVI